MSEQAAEGCPDGPTLLGLLNGALTSPSRVHQHLETCTSCQAALAMLRSRQLGGEATGHVQHASSQVALPELEAGTPIAHFVIERKLGVGGMGVVYLARDSRLDRPVALKLLRSGSASVDDSNGARARLLREAHAMAKLSHANVVTIFEVGAYGEQVFIAMELVAGGTLSEWLRETPRTWQAIVSVFSQAGRGLAAAHAAGLIHRDFKPDNVLISSDQRARVTDFGVARLVNEVHEAPVALSLTTPLASPLTVEGTVVGTVAYMSPEQFSGKQVDARSDLYSFCFALYEALYGERPFKRPGEVDVPPAPQGSSVPPWLRVVVLKGLRADPTQRYASMTELVDALGRVPPTKQRSAAPLLVGLGLLVVVGIAWAVRARSPCGGLSRQLATAWNDELRATLAKKAQGTPDEAARWVFAEKALDRYAAQWLALGQSVCGAANVSPAALQLQLECLDERRRALSTVTRMLASREDPRLRDATVLIIDQLPLVSGCAEAGLLSVKPPIAPGTAGRVQELEDEILLAGIDTDLGKTKAAVEHLREIAAEAKKLQNPLLECSATLGQARAFSLSGKFTEARAAYTEALTIAEPNRLDRATASATAELLAIAVLLGEPREKVDAMIEPTLKAIARAGNSKQQQFMVEHVLSIVYASTGRTEQAIPHVRKALALVRETHGGDSLSQTLELNNLGAMADTMGDFGTALDSWNEALALERRLVGRNRESSVLVWANIALTSAHLGRHPEALEASEHVTAQAAERGENVYTAMMWGVQANALLDAGKRAEGEAALGKSVALLKKLKIENAPDGAEVLRQAIEGWVRLGDFRAASQTSEQLLVNEAKRLDADSPEWIFNLRIVGAAFASAGERAQAVETLERGLSLVQKNPSFVGYSGELKFHLARAMLLAPRDRARAKTLADEAEVELASSPDRRVALTVLKDWKAQTFR